MVMEDPRVAHATAALERGRQAQSAFHLLEEHLLDRQRQLDKLIFSAIDNATNAEYGTYAQHLQQLCLQKYEAHRFMTALMQKLKAGEGAGRILQPLMDLPDER